MDYEFQSAGTEQVFQDRLDAILKHSGSSSKAISLLLGLNTHTAQRVIANE
jgi:hypothetical protein